MARTLKLVTAIFGVGITFGHAQAEDIVIGAALSFSGIGASFAADARSGVDIAVPELNAKGGINGRQIRVVYHDTASDASKAVAAYRGFASQPDVAAMMSISSTEFLALDPLSNEAKLPNISIASSSNVERFSPWSFRVQLITGKALPVVLQELQSLKKVKNVALIYDDTQANTVAEMATVKSAAPKLGLHLVAEETFAKGDQNFSLQLTRIAATKPDLLYMAAITNEATIIISQARAYGITIPIIGGAGLNDPRVFEMNGEAANGVMTYFPFDSSDSRPLVQEFVSKYKAAHNGESPPAYAALGYDSVLLIANAIQRAGSNDREAIRKALGETEGLEGLNGIYSYDGSGDKLIQKPNIYEYKDGTLQRISK